MVRQIRFANEFSETLAGTLHLPEGPFRFGVVLGHCFTCSRHTRVLSAIAGQLSEAGLAAIRFDFSGNGQSEGDFSRTTMSRFVSEMNSAADQLKAAGAEEIGFAGHSMGAAAALLTAAGRELPAPVCMLAGRTTKLAPQSFLTESQWQDLNARGRAAFESRGRRLELSQAFFDEAWNIDLPAVIRQLSGPLLVIHGDRDEIVPRSEAMAVEGEDPGRVRVEIIPGADHMFSDPGHRDAAARLAADYFTGWAERDMA